MEDVKLNVERIQAVENGLRVLKELSDAAKAAISEQEYGDRFHAILARENAVTIMWNLRAVEEFVEAAKLDVREHAECAAAVAEALPVQ